MNLLKHLKDFKDGVVDSLITAPYALGDFIARGTGFRDWQMGTGSYYMEQAKVEVDLITTAIFDEKARNLIFGQLKNEAEGKPMYFLWWIFGKSNNQKWR